MRAVVIAGGPVFPQFLKDRCEGADLVVCADSGADTAMKAGIIPHKFYGDMDSVSAEAREWINSFGIVPEVFPVEKDMTDSELALRSIPKEYDLLFICSLRGRPDHVIANELLAARLRREGRCIEVTDGITRIIYLKGPETYEYTMESEDEVVSIIPFEIESEGVKGVSMSGFHYPLLDANLESGSSLTISNRGETLGTLLGISVKSGVVGVFRSKEE